MNVGTLLRWGLRWSDRIGDRPRRLDDVRLLREIRILRLFDHASRSASGVPAS